MTENDRKELTLMMDAMRIDVDAECAYCDPMGVLERVYQRANEMLDDCISIVRGYHSNEGKTNLNDWTALIESLRERREFIKRHPDIAEFVPPYLLSAAADVIEEMQSEIKRLTNTLQSKDG